MMPVCTVKKNPYAPVVFIFLCLFVRCFCFCSVGEATSIVPSQQAAHLAESIRLLAQAREHALEEYTILLGQGNIEPAGRHDYQLFIGYLDSRIQSYCEELHELTGLSGFPDLPCSFSTGFSEGGTAPPLFPGAAAGTSDEQLAVLDESLSAALGRFDDMLLKEQENIATHPPRQRESSPDATQKAGAEAGNGEKEGEKGDESGGKDGQESDSREASSSTNEKGARSSEDSRQGEGAGDGAQEPVRSTSSHDDQLDASDDDVVARQLREAAEKETDPEVKKKLWEEYRKYKEGMR